MYQTWQWGGTSPANPTAAGYVQPPATAPVGATQWPVGYNQYPGMTPDVQQQWAAWQQYAYSNTVPVGQVPTTTPYTAGYPEYQTAQDPTQTQALSQSNNNNSQTSEKPKTPAEELAPKDSSESKKLKELEQKAQQWTSFQQPASAASWSYATTTPATTAPAVSAPTSTPSSDPLKTSTVTTVNASQPITHQTQFDKEEEEFEQQFKEWEKQFEAWKEQNQNHPDKEAFAQYEKQWQEWRIQLLQKKEQMQKAKALQSSVVSATSSVSASSTTITPTVSVPPPSQTTVGVSNNNASVVDTSVTAPSTGMYYPPAQYMYMQPYMYPGNVPVAPPAIPAPPVVPPQFPPYGPPPGQPPFGSLPVAPVPPGDPNMPPQKTDNSSMKPGGDFDQNRFNLGHSEENFGEEAYQDFRDPGMYPPNIDEQYQRDPNFVRGRGRGRGVRGRGRGRGGRWPDGGEMEGAPGGMRNPGPGLLDPPDFPKRPVGFGGPPGEFSGPPGGYREGPGEFRGGSREFREGPRGPDGNVEGPPFNYGNEFQGGYPPEELPFPEDGSRPRRNFPPDRFPFRDGQGPPFPNDHGPPFPDGQGPLFNDEQGPPLRDNQAPPFRDGKGPLLRDGQGPPFHEGQGPPFRDGQGPPFRDGQGPPFRDGQGPPFRDGQGPPFRDGQGPPFRDGQGPPFRDGQGPPFRDGQGPPFRDGQGPPFRDGQGPPFRDGPVPFRDRPLLSDVPRDGPLSSMRDIPTRDKPLIRDAPSKRDVPPLISDIPPNEPPLHRYPPDEFEEEFPPSSPFDERFPPDSERFPPSRDVKDNSRFIRERDHENFAPQEDSEYGPFGENHPPFDDRFPPGRGRFPGRGRRFPPGRGEFDRFGPPFPSGAREEEPFGPDFRPPGGRFPHRMPPPGLGPRPPFEPGFGPPGDRFHDDPFLREGHPRPPMHFKSVDYTHRPASAIMGEDFNRHYEYESDYQEDVAQFRENFTREFNLAPCNPVFSQVKVESFDYGHGLGPNSSSIIPIKDKEMPVPVKVFDYSHRGERSPPPRERLLERNSERPSSYRDRDVPRSRDKDRNKERDNDRERERSRRDHREREKEPREKDRERDLKRERDWDRDRRKSEPDREKRTKWDNNTSAEKSNAKEPSNKKESSEVKTEASFKSQNDSFGNESSSETTLIEDLLNPPKRASRPKQLVIILRGLPGSGKTYVAKLIKDKEIANGGSAPRILSLDDYFMVEAEVTDTDPDTGKRVTRKEFKFEYELEMEESYRASLFKSFKKTIDDRFFPFIIVDAVHEKSKQYEQYWSYAKQRGFQVYIAEMDCNDPVICHKRNIHNRSLGAITKILNNWEKKPRHFMGIDVRSLLQDVTITEVEMEVEGNEETETKDNSDGEMDSSSAMDHVPSRWEKLEATEAKLDQLDGLRLGKKKHSSMEDYLQLPDDYEERKCEPGKKRVRWADLEERKEQDRLRAIGFVVGQTDWNKLTDPTHADRALTKTKYF